MTGDRGRCGKCGVAATRVVLLQNGKTRWAARRCADEACQLDSKHVISVKEIVA